MHDIYLRPRLLFFILPFFLTPLHATHWLGAQVYYDCLSPTDYKITLVENLDCNGANSYGASHFSLGNVLFDWVAIGRGGDCNLPRLTSRGYLRQRFDITPVCIGNATMCNGSNPMAPYVGIAEFISEAVFAFDSVLCSRYQVGFRRCCRPALVTSGNFW